MRNYFLYTFSLINWVADLFGVEAGLFGGKLLYNIIIASVDETPVSCPHVLYHLQSLVCSVSLTVVCVLCITHSCLSIMYHSHS